MKVAAIDWQLFWQAWRQQDPSSEGIGSRAGFLPMTACGCRCGWISTSSRLKSFDCNRGFFWDDRGAARLACASNRRSELS